jgi:uncharacterized Zn finger protein (UPF0148 family)
MARLRERRLAEGLTTNGTAPKPCRRCGGVKAPRDFSPYCPICQQIRAEFEAARAEAWQAQQAARAKRKTPAQHQGQHVREALASVHPSPPSSGDRDRCECCMAIIRSGRRCKRCAPTTAEGGTP